MKRVLFLTFLLIRLITPSTGQGLDTTQHPKPEKDLIDIATKFLRISPQEPRPRKGVAYFSLTPTTASNQSSNKVLISSINAAFYLGHPDSTYISGIYFVPYTDLGRQFGFTSTLNLWTPNNTLNVPGEFKIQKLSPYSFGLGSGSTRRNRFTIEYNYVRLYMACNRIVAPAVFLGMGLNYDRHYNIRQIASGVTPLDQYGIGNGSSSTSTGITFNALYDNRKNSMNPDAGLYSTLVFRTNPALFSNHDLWSSLYADIRRYFRMPTARRTILALWGFYWGAYGRVPYFNLPGTSMEYNARSGRGYGLGRFRGTQMLYAEGEYRFTLSRNGLWGGVVFANLQSYTDLQHRSFDLAIPAAGVGARIKFNRTSNINLDVDFGFGRDSFNLYVNLGEIF